MKYIHRHLRGKPFAGFLLAVFLLCIAVNMTGVRYAEAAGGSITINTVTLTLQIDADSNSIADIGDTIRINATVGNADNVTNGNCTTSGSAATVDLSKYGGAAAVNVPLTVCNNGVSDVFELDFVVTDAGVGGIDVGAVNAASQVTFTATDSDDLGGVSLGSTLMPPPVDTIAPFVTDGNISISGGTGTGGAYIVGDSIEVTWDAATDGTADVASATANLSGWGGGAAVAMVDDGSGCDVTTTDNIWCAEYTIVGTEGIDATGVNASVTATDDAGNSTTRADTTGATVDTIVPTLQSITSTTADANYGPGDAINITATYSEALAAGSTITVDLNNTVTGVVLSSVAGNAVSGTYTVGATGSGQSIADLTVSALSSENIIDDAGNVRSTSSVPGSPNNLGDSSNIVVDTTAPQGTVTVDTDPMTEANNVQTVTVTYNELMDGASTPTITFGGNSGALTSNSDGAWSGGNVWTESFTLTDADEETAGVTVGSSAAADASGNVEGADIGDTFNIDTQAPVVTDGNISISGGGGLSGEYIVGDTVVVTWDAGSDGNSDIISATADMSAWGGALQAAVAMRDDGAGCDLAGGLDGIWCAQYTIDGTEGIEAVGVDATVTAVDDAGNSTGPIADTTGATVDTVVPTLQSFTSTTGDGAYPAGSVINITATYSEALAAGSSVTVNLNNTVAGLVLNTVVGTDVSRTYTVGALGSGQDVLDLSVSAIVAESVQDAAGNTQSGSAVPGSPNNIADTSDIEVDTTAPQGTVTVGAPLLNETSLTQTVTVTYDEDMDGGSTPTITFVGNSGALTSEADGTWAAANIWTESFTLTDADEDSVGVTVDSSAATDEAGNVEGADIGDAFNIDTEGPVVTPACISVDGASGTGLAFKNGDTATPTWDNTALCDNAGGANNDIVSVEFDARDFESGSAAVAGVDTTPNVYTALLPALDDQDDTSNNITVTVEDDAGNVAAVAGTNDYVVDTILPEFAAVNPVVALTQAGGATTLPTNLWYYYNTPAEDFVNVEVTNAVEDDGNPLANVVMCIESMDTDTPAELCDAADFLDPLKTSVLSVDTNVTSTSNYDLAGLTAWPTQQGGYVMNFVLVDDAGNMVEGGAGDTFVGIFNVNPRYEATMPDLDNATTTDFSDILDFTNIVGLTFNVNDGINDYGRITFTDPVNLTDQATVTALANFATNVTLDDGVIRVDSSEIAALDLGATVMMRNATAVQPALVVKDDVGTVIENIPNTAGAGDSYVLSGGHGTVSNFVWNVGAQTLTFDVTGFSEYDSDEVPTITSTTPADGATSVTRTRTVIINFSEPMDTSSFTFTDSSGVPYNAPVWSNADQTVTLTHTTAWGTTEDVTITVTAATDLTGNNLSGTTDFTFRTRSSSGSSGGGGGGTTTVTTTQETQETQETSEVSTQETSEEGTQEGTEGGEGTGGEEGSALDEDYYTDIAGHWATEYINKLHAAGINGYTDENGDPLYIFDPDNQITRAELIVMLMKVRYGELPEVGESPYPDVPADHWAAAYIAKAKELGIVGGYEDGNFMMDNYATRAEALKMILLTWITQEQIDAATENTTCSDVVQTEWYAPYFNYALGNSIIGGYEDEAGEPIGLCGPENNVTRAEGAKMIVLTGNL